MQRPCDLPHGLNRDVRRPHRGFPCRLGSSQPPLLSTSQDHPLLWISTHRRNTRGGVSWLRCLGRPVVSRHSLTYSYWCAPPRTVSQVHHALPHKLDLEINRRRYAPRTVGKSRACQVVPTTPGQGSSERGGQSVTIDSAILTTSSQSRKGASMPAASAGVIPSSSSCGRKRL